jgi:hypothetical protein
MKHNSQYKQDCENEYRASAIWEHIRREVFKRVVWVQPKLQKTKWKQDAYQAFAV